MNNASWLIPLRDQRNFRVFFYFFWADYNYNFFVVFKLFYVLFKSPGIISSLCYAWRRRGKFHISF